MKNLNAIIGKFVVVLSILIAINMMVFFSSAMGEKGDSVKNSISFKDESAETRSRLVEFEERLTSIEKNLTAVNNYDKYVYSQLLDLGIDTVNFDIYRISDVDFSSLTNDSMFMYLDDRSLYASQLVSLQLSRFIEKSESLKIDKNMLNAYPSISPVRTIDFRRVMSRYGWRIHPIYHVPLFHDGVDISAPLNAKVYSTMDGTVEKVVKSKFGYGNEVEIKNGYGYEILYAHLNAIHVTKGQSVKKGQLIGSVGSSGLTTGVHLHYEIRRNDDLKDPLGYFYNYLTTELAAEHENTH